MRWYSQGRKQYSSLNKLINCLIVFTTFAVMGFAAIPSYLMSNKSMANAAKGPDAKRQSARLADLMKKRKGSILKRAYHALPSVSGVTETALPGKYGKGVKFTGTLDKAFVLSAQTRDASSRRGAYRDIRHFSPR